jgi:hypothetical protein
MTLMITQMAMMYAGYHTTVEPIDRFYPISRVLYAKDKKGKVLMVLPADYVLWSSRFAEAVAEIMDQTKGDQFELWTAGGVSKKTGDQLSKAGWVVNTDVYSKLKEKLGAKTQ